MPWFKVDDALPANHKVLSIPRGPRRLAAMGAWTLGGAWTAANLKEGFVPAGVVAELAIGPKVVADLVASGLWLQRQDGYQMHDFLDYNPTAEQVQAERAAAAERQRRAREKAKESRRDSRVTHGEVTAVVTVPPTRPDPTRPFLGSPWEEEVEVEVAHSTSTSALPSQMQEGLRLVFAAECEHGDPHPEMCPRCRVADRRRSA